MAALQATAPRRLNGRDLTTNTAISSPDEEYHMQATRSVLVRLSRGREYIYFTHARGLIWSNLVLGTVFSSQKEGKITGDRRTEPVNGGREGEVATSIA